MKAFVVIIFFFWVHYHHFWCSCAPTIFLLLVQEDLCLPVIRVGATCRAVWLTCHATSSCATDFFLNDIDFLGHRLPRPYLINLDYTSRLVFSAVEELWIFTTYCVSASFLSVCEVTSASMLEWRFCGCERTCVRV